MVAGWPARAHRRSRSPQPHSARTRQPGAQAPFLLHAQEEVCALDNIFILTLDVHAKAGLANLRQAFQYQNSLLKKIMCTQDDCQ